MPTRQIASLVFGLAAVEDVAAQQPQPILEEIIVTATRVETNLQQTPMSIETFTGQELELAGVDTGLDLGIMVPNVVINPGATGYLGTNMIVRGLPGVETYVDGVSVRNGGFLLRNFVELERVEVLRGPQGTHFGRNTNGGAIQFITRPPSDVFAAKFDIELGEFERRMVRMSVDAPITDRLKTKWTAASNENDGFLESQTAPFALGDQDDTLFRADVLWEPTPAFSLRFTASDEKRRGSDPRIVRISNPGNPFYLAYNVLAGNPDFLAQARAVDPSFPAPPFALAGDRYTPESHEPGYPGGTLGKWQTRSDTLGPTTVADERYVTLTLDWDISDRWSLESLTSYGDGDARQIADFDASEFSQAIDSSRATREIKTQELRLTGNQFDGRLRSLLGFYYNEAKFWNRPSNWWFWEFAIPNTGPGSGQPGPPGTDGRPQLNIPALAYVQAWGATVGNPAVANMFPLTFLSADRLFRDELADRALFGELTIGLLDTLDLTLGFRFSEGDSSFAEYLPADSFRPLEPGTVPSGDPFAPAMLIAAENDPDFGTISTPRLAISYEPTDEIYLYASYSEGFTSSEVVENPNTLEPIVLDPEIVKTREIGLRSDWLGNRLRLNATYFDSRWDGLRVGRTVPDPNNPGLFLPRLIPTDDGVAKATGLEVELFYLPGERWEIDFALGLLDTEYLEIGDPPANGTGLQPGIPFAYAPETSYSLGLRYRLPLAAGGGLMFVGNYGWMDDYQRAPPNEFQPKNPDGSDKPEPGYGILNARVIYQRGNANWSLALYGTNLTDEWYVNGGLDAGFAWGYDFGTIGRPREIGIGLQFTLD